MGQNAVQLGQGAMQFFISLGLMLYVAFFMLRDGQKLIALLVGRDTKLPDYIVLLSTLGGFVVFGMNGFVIGPLVAALFVAFWGIFMREFNMAEVAEGEEMLE